MRITVWNEGLHEQGNPRMAATYPDGMHGAIAAGLGSLLPDAAITTSTLADPQQGIAGIDDTDVLFWWGHIAHDDVSDETVKRVHDRVLEGMGLVMLHSGHFSRIFKALMGTTCSLAWRNEGERELVWTVNPTHPIARGVEHPIVIDKQEMYGEFFDIPTPDELVFVSSFAGGEVFRSGVTFRRGLGKIFYFSPGDEAYPVYQHPQIHRVLANAAEWAMPVEGAARPDVTNPPRDWFA